jgi:transcriptional regulator with XRE-family HTH domain
MAEPSEFGRRIKAFRERAGLTQKELAEKAGIPRQVIGFVESGVQAYLSLPNTIKVSVALGVSIDALVHHDPLANGADCRYKKEAVEAGD